MKFKIIFHNNLFYCTRYIFHDLCEFDKFNEISILFIVMFLTYLPFSLLIDICAFIPQLLYSIKIKKVEE